LRITLWLIFAAIGPGIISGPAQDHLRDEEVAKLDDLLDQGEYTYAARSAASLLERLHVWGPDREAILVLTHIGRSQVEMGRFSEALKVLSQANALASTIPYYFYDPALFRETALLQLEAGEYQAAANTAAKAVKLAQDHNQERLRVGYCRSIEAMALLRLGKPDDAELLSLKAVKACPKKAGKYFVFAPRILYTACLVASHQEKYADAEEYCRRGLEIAQQWKRENRDLSLGYLALAEAYLEAGDLARSREAATKNVEMTARLFGEQHQDMVQALGLLARISAKQGNMADACTQANRAVKIATALFGAGSTGAAGPVRALRKMDACLQQAPR
jgi:tetratricopeptide (TPR) repeat protein